MKTEMAELIDEVNGNEKDVEEKNNDQSKFKKVEMPVFNGEDPDAWLFRVDRYFQIHKLTDLEKMTMATISFKGLTLNWYRAQEERDKFKNWLDLKERLLIRFRSVREGSICGQFLRIRQESSMEEYRNQFDKLMAPVSDLPDRVIEETFMNGLLPWIKAEVEFCRPVGLAEMMLLAQLTKNREIIQNEANLKGYSGGEHQTESTEMPYLTENHKWRADPEEVYGYMKNKIAGWDVLIKWKGLS
ncbi:transposon Tf2-1 polyprotein isoform X1 [Cucumis melo var. makuwa]|uniref:Transposon Tf2-1 polyprotein isoform X1 n=1 Tax=Cucumis melo var. makuwa TaxID=1194695 RepID=A0A5A7U4I6_CUCMM|nr:transposon Tf2-1 polyprotein isoform X1 [Cucumis melo var. makuwa]